MTTSRRAARPPFARWPEEPRSTQAGDTAAQREWPRSFADRLIGPMPKFSEVARCMWARNPWWLPSEAERVPVLRAGLPAL